MSLLSIDGNNNTHKKNCKTAGSGVIHHIAGIKLPDSNIKGNIQAL
jgi:hypothetical protein